MVLVIKLDCTTLEKQMPSKMSLFSCTFKLFSCLFIRSFSYLIALNSFISFLHNFIVVLFQYYLFMYLFIFSFIYKVEIFRAYYTVARGYEFYVRVARTISHEWRFSKLFPKARRTFANTFEIFQRLPKTFEENSKMFRSYTNEFKYNLRDKIDEKRERRDG